MSLRALASGADGAAASVDRALAVKMDKEEGEDEEEKGRGGRVEAEKVVVASRRCGGEIDDDAGVDSPREALAAATTAARRLEEKDAAPLLLVDERAPRARPRRPEAATPCRIPATPTAAELLDNADADASGEDD